MTIDYPALAVAVGAGMLILCALWSFVSLIFGIESRAMRNMVVVLCVVGAPLFLIGGYYYLSC